MSENKRKRLSGTDCRLELTNKFMLRTLRKIRARVSEHLMELARLKELSIELDALSYPEECEDEAAALREFTEFSDAIIDYCVKVRERLDGPFIKATNRHPADPSHN